MNYNVYYYWLLICKMTSTLETMVKNIEEKREKKKIDKLIQQKDEHSEYVSIDLEDKDEPVKKTNNKPSINKLLEKATTKYNKFDPEDPLNEHHKPCCSCCDGCDKFICKRFKRIIAILFVTSVVIIFIGTMVYTQTTKTYDLSDDVSNY